MNKKDVFVPGKDSKWIANKYNGQSIWGCKNVYTYAYVNSNVRFVITPAFKKKEAIDSVFDMKKVKPFDPKEDLNWIRMYLMDYGSHGVVVSYRTRDNWGRYEEGISTDGQLIERRYRIYI